MVVEEVEVVEEKEEEVVIAFEVEAKNVGNSSRYKLVHQQRSEESLVRPQVKQRVKGMPQPDVAKKTNSVLKETPIEETSKRRLRRAK